MQKIIVPESDISAISEVAVKLEPKVKLGKYLLFILVSFISLAACSSRIHNVTSFPLSDAKYAKTVPQLPPPRTDICFYSLILTIKCKKLQFNEDSNSLYLFYPQTELEGIHEN